jgi:hypothetical protein
MDFSVALVPTSCSQSMERAAARDWQDVPSLGRIFSLKLTRMTCDRLK